MRLEQQLHDNLEAAAQALIVPEPRRVPAPKPMPGRRRPLAFVGAGAVAALALIVIPALIINPSQPTSTMLVPVPDTESEPTNPSVVTTIAPPSTAGADADEVILGESSIGDFRLVVSATIEEVETEPPVATVLMKALDSRDVLVDEVVIGEQGMFFWYPVSGPDGVCQLSPTPTPLGGKVGVQILLSASVGCTTPYVFEIDQSDGSLVSSEPSAEDVAWLFVEAWGLEAEQAMESLASLEAIEQAAAMPLQKVSIPGSCEGAAGSTYCNWETEGGNLVVRVTNGPTPLVVEVRLEPSTKPQ